MSDRRIFPESTRKKIESALEKLIDLLDQIDADPDIEEENEDGDGSLTGVGVDDEPSLGSTNAVNQERAWKVGGTDLEYDGEGTIDANLEPSIGSVVSHESRSQELWAQGPTDDREEDDEREPDELEEPELGATTEIDQEAAWTLHWEGSCGAAEPSLGAPENIDQTHWNQGTGWAEEEPALATAPCGNQTHWGEGTTALEDDELELDHAEDGIGDMDGVLEQGFRGLGYEHCE